MKTREVVAHITSWLDDYARRAGTRGFVVGVSGGVDSAVTASLAARTGRPLLCAELPIHQGPEQMRRARRQIEALEARHPNATSVQVELTEPFDRLVAALPRAEPTPARELALANTRARLRMATLYYFAGAHGDLVVGTGNKVEDFGVGFFTKYGDGGVDISPIADLTKSEVYEVAAELEVIEDILKAPPTDGLWGDARTDEDQLGATYPELEWAMAFDGDASGLSEREREVLAIYRRLREANRHKMVPVPVCEVPDALR